MMSLRKSCVLTWTHSSPGNAFHTFSTSTTTLPSVRRMHHSVTHQSGNGSLSHRCPMKFVRVYPPRIPANKGDPSVNPPNLLSSEPLGTGSYHVTFTPLVLPSTATAPSVVGLVAIKFTSTDRDMLWNEGRIYNAFRSRPRRTASTCHRSCPNDFTGFISIW